MVSEIEFPKTKCNGGISAYDNYKEKVKVESASSVSYTHLTLPTIYSV